METKARYILIGAFTVAGFLGILGFLLWFGNSESNRQFAYYDVLFEDVSGISRGSKVRFAGLSVGQVTQLAIDPNGSGLVRTRLEVAAQTPVRVDSVATLETQGVTGLSAVSISRGTPTEPLATDASDGIPELKAGRSTLQTLSQDAPALVSEALSAIESVNQILNEENRDNISAIISNIELASEQLDSSMSAFNDTMTQIDKAVGALGGFTQTVENLSDDAAQVLQSADDVINEFKGLSAQAEQTLADGSQALNRADGVIDNELRNALDELSRTSADLRQTLDTIEPQAQDLLESWTATGTSATARLDQAEGLITSVQQTADAFDAETMRRLNDALSQVATDLPQITGDLRRAANSAEQAFVSMGRLVSDAQAPVSSFLKSGLPEFGKLASDLRGLVSTVDNLASRLGNGPARALLNSDVPEFRR